MAEEHFFYRAYGLNIGCDFALPELTPTPATPEAEASRAVWLQLAEGTGAAWQNPAAHFCRIGREFAQVAWPDVGRFTLESGRRVSIEPAPNAAQATLRAFLLGPVFAILLFQRGFLVLHASAVALRDGNGNWGAVGFAGQSGDGKSTMAATLHARGHRLIGDDVIAVPPLETAPLEVSPRLNSPREAPRLPLIFPAFPQLRLWPTAVAALGADADSLPLLYPQQERRIWRAAPGFETDAVPLRALFLLQNADEISVRPLTPAAALMRILEHVYCVETSDRNQTAAQFARCGALARALPIFELQRPKDLSRLSEVAALVEASWAP